VVVLRYDWCYGLRCPGELVPGRCWCGWSATWCRADPVPW